MLLRRSGLLGVGRENPGQSLNVLGRQACSTAESPALQCRSTRSEKSREMVRVRMTL